MVTRSLDQSGQALLEYILVMSVIIFIWVGISNGLRKSGVFQKVFGEPWFRLSQTIERGVPATSQRELTDPYHMHPTAWERHSTRQGQ